jgi:hypothetical protein
MDQVIQSYIKGYNDEIQLLFNNLREIIYKSVSCDIEEKMWAKLPSFYAGERFIRLIPFNDHINVEAAAIVDYKSQLVGFKITPKGMLQVYLHQEVPCKILGAIFTETLEA